MADGATADRATLIISWTAKITGERMCCAATRIELPGNGKLVIYPVDSWKFALDFSEYDQLKIQVPEILKVRAAVESEPQASDESVDLPVPYQGCPACEQFLQAAVDAAQRHGAALSEIRLAR